MTVLSSGLTTILPLELFTTSHGPIHEVRIMEGFNFYNSIATRSVICLKAPEQVSKWTLSLDCFISYKVFLFKKQ